MQTRTVARYIAFEIAESAINEAAGQVRLADVFSPRVFGSDLVGFFWSISTEDEESLARYCPGGNCHEFRTLLGVNGSKESRMWTAYRFPSTQFAGKFEPELTRKYAAKNDSFRTVSSVSLRPLTFRRVVVPGWKANDPNNPGVEPVNSRRWENYGVLQFSCTVKMEGVFGALERRMTVDRLFTVDLSACPPQPPHPDVPCPVLVLSDRNLRTVIGKP